MDMPRACSKCQSDRVVVLEQRQLVVCGACEHVAPVGEVVATPRLHNSTMLIYDRPVLHIFLSYGHDRYQKVAFLLKDHFRSRGHSVWVDVEKLTPGCDWEAGIADALTWVKEAQENGRVLLLMTPHALRRPDGYCLNEIARASSLKLNIFPVLVCDSEPPQSISMLPYFDLQSCLPQPDESVDTAAWDALVAAAMSAPKFQSKVLKLTGLLEAVSLFVSKVTNDMGLDLMAQCESMRNTMVTAIGGLDNLNLFNSAVVDDAGSKVTTPSYRRVLSPKHAPPLQPSKSLNADSSSLPAIVDASATRYVFVFDESSAPLAIKLHEDLKAQGFNIHPHLAASPTEPHARRDAISWAASGKMILFLTPQSVGRPHGVCLNDISAAMASNVGFVPLMVRPCEIPLSICRIQWLDLSDCLVLNKQNNTSVVNDVKYSVRMPQLVTALRGNLDHDGQQARLFSIFSPFSFQAEISKFTQGFAGREWVMDQLSQWKASPSQTFWLTGQIGTGKTALAAFIIQSQPEVRAFHLVSKEDEQTQNHRRCILSLAYQLTTQLPDYAAFLQQGDPLEEIVPVSSVSELLNTLLVVPLNAIAQPATVPLVILIDGLDALQDSNAFENCIVSSLVSLVQKLPSWVRLILTSREDPSVMRKLQGLAPQVALDKCVPQSKNDIVKYLQSALIPFVPNGEKDVPPETVQFIVARSEGLFLYASHIVHALNQKRLTLDKLESFPVGMGGYLRQYFEDQFSADNYETSVRPLLEVLCAAFEPMHLTTLHAVMKWDTYSHRDFLGSFKSLLYVSDENELKPFHTSVFEWLQDASAAGRFFVRVENGHERIGLWAWSHYDTVLRATTDISNMNFELEPNGPSANMFDQLRAPIYIIRHALNHLHLANTDASMDCMHKFSSDEKFQLARRLVRLRESGLESFFHGDIDRVVAHTLLTENGAPGAFLIRYSAKQKSYCASFIDKVVEGLPQIKHNIIYHLDSGAYCAVQPKEVQKSTPIYPDLVSFVEAYQRKGILTTAVPHTKGAPDAIAT